MSRETMQHLNSGAILLGNVAERGNGDGSWRAWWDKASLQDVSPYYDGFIPVEDIKRRTFNYLAVPRRIAVEIPATFEDMTHLDETGQPMRWAVQLDRQAIARDDTHHVMGVFKDGYKAHQLGETLIGMTSNIVGDTLGITSAGVIKGGAVGWLEISVNETQHLDKYGVDFRPNLLAGTSFDGSIATFWKRTVTATVCDNTFEIARGIAGQTFKIKHSRNSGFKLNEAREALSLIGALTDEFTAEVATLVETTVTDTAWNRFLEAHVPLTEDGAAKKGKSLTLATNKQDALRRLWNNDNRVSPWKGTAWGVLQAVNTWGHHEQTVRGATRQERNALNMVTGAQAKVDDEVLTLLDKVLANA